MTVSERPIDPYLLNEADALPGRTLERGRVLAFADVIEDSVVAALAGLANGRGGHLLIGVDTERDGETVRSTPGVDAARAEQMLRELAARIEPPVDDSLQMRRLPADLGREILIVNVRQSSTPPHIDTRSGLVYLAGATGVSSIRSRAALDALYVKGKAERERAERLIEAMTERLMLAHFAYYGIGIVACLQQPTADAYLWAREHPEELANDRDAFIRAWEFTPAMAKVRPAEVELRNEREVCGLVRVTRSGCVTAGETRRRPQGDVIGSRAELGERLQMIVDTVCRILSQAETTLIVPRLFCEGLKGTHLLLAGQPDLASPPSRLDAVQAPGPTGDATDPEYRRALAALFLDQLCRPFLNEPGDGS